MPTAGLGTRLRALHEYNLRPVWDLLVQFELGFLLGAVLEELVGRNPYFAYRERRGKDRYVTRRIDGHEITLDLYDRGLSRHLFVHGVHELAASDAYRAALADLRDATEGRVAVLDVGANIGYYVLQEARVLGNRASIHAFEPDPHNRELLEENVDRNGYADQVAISASAVDDRAGERTFHRSTHSNWNRVDRRERAVDADVDADVDATVVDDAGTTVVDDADAGTTVDDRILESFTVETTTIDGYLADREIDPEDVGAVRMDLEGHEVAVLQGMERVLEAPGRRVLFVEFHPDVVGSAAYESAVGRLADHDFSIRFVNQQWEVLQVETIADLQNVRGSHVRVIVTKGLTT